MCFYCVNAVRQNTSGKLFIDITVNTKEMLHVFVLSSLHDKQRDIVMYRVQCTALMHCGSNVLIDNRLYDAISLLVKRVGTVWAYFGLKIQVYLLKDFETF